jgi:hypothetical protein
MDVGDGTTIDHEMWAAGTAMISAVRITALGSVTTTISTKPNKFLSNSSTSTFFGAIILIHHQWIYFTSLQIGRLELTRASLQKGEQKASWVLSNIRTIFVCGI